MRLSFNTKYLRTICEDENNAIQEYGESVTNKLKSRLADLIACTNIDDMVAGNPKIIESDRNQDISIKLDDEYKMIIRANHTINPIDKSGKVDWKRVHSIKIMSID